MNSTGVQKAENIRFKFLTKIKWGHLKKKDNEDIYSEINKK
jgi:hypothetical protein